MPRFLTIGGASAFLASVLALVLLSRTPAPPIAIYASVLVVGGGMVSALLWRGATISAPVVLAIAGAAHTCALFGYTVFEDDFYRFIWDGWRLLETGTPYGAAPLEFQDDPNVPEEMRSILEWVNYPQFPTIYGPVLQAVFAVTVFLAGADEQGLRIVFAAASLLTTALLLRRFTGKQVALFAWNPLVVAETTLHLHPDIFLGLALVAAILSGARHPIIAGAFFAIAACIKLVALAAWPMLLRLRPSAMTAALVVMTMLYGVFAIQGMGVGLDSTETFAKIWHFNPLAYEALYLLIGPTWGRIAALAVAGAFVVWFHARSQSFDEVPLAAIFGIILLFAPAVNAWYLLWLLPLAVGRKEVWPYVASAVLPLSYLTGINLEDFALEDFEVHPLARLAQWSALAGAIAYDVWRASSRQCKQHPQPTPIAQPRVSVVIPALNEEGSVGETVRGIIASNPPGLVEVIVADNGSKDRTAQVAKGAGARVICQPEKGYGAACLAALEELDPCTNIVLFMDADLSDKPEEAAALLEPITAGKADLVIGSRVLGHTEPGAMSVPQRFGNWLATRLMRVIWGVRYTDLGPFRAVRRDALDQLAMADRDFGWTIEMQVRAAKRGMRVAERPADYRRRIGVSKISGTMRGVLAAGSKILFVIGREAFGDFGRSANSPVTNSVLPAKER